MFNPTKATMKWYWKAIEAAQKAYNEVEENGEEKLWNQIELIAEMFERSEAQVWVDVKDYGRWN